jgi:hypothetical protein
VSYLIKGIASVVKGCGLQVARKQTLSGVNKKKQFRVLVTGGSSGRLGPEVCDAIGKKGMVAFPTTSSNPKVSNFLDLTKSFDVATKMIELGIDAVVHQGALSKGSYERIDKANVKGTEGVVTAANFCGKPVIYLSSVAADYEGLEELGEERVPYALSKQRALKEAIKSRDIVILSAGALVGDSTKKGATAAITDLNGVTGLFRVELGTNSDVPKPRIFQPTTYHAVAKGVVNLLLDISNNPNRSKGVRKIAAVGDPMPINSFVRKLNPLAPIVVTIRDLVNLKPFTSEHNDGVASSEFIDLDQLDSGVPLPVDEFKALLGDDFPGSAEVKRVALKSVSKGRAIHLGLAMGRTVLKRGSLEMLRGFLKVAKTSSLLFSTYSLKEQVKKDFF